MKMENEEQKHDSSPGRRSFFRKLVAVAAATGVSGLLLGKLAEPVSAASSGEVAFYTGSSSQSGDPNLFWDNVNKRLGVDTSAPEAQTHIGGAATADVFCGIGPHPATLVSGKYVGPAMNYGYSGRTFGRGSGFFNVRPDASATPPNPSLRFMTANTQRMIITNTGEVGIGTSTPPYLFSVLGGNPTLSIEEAASSNSNLIFRRAGNSIWAFTNNYANYGSTTDNLGLYDYTMLSTVLQVVPGGDGSGGLVNIGSPLPALQGTPTALNVQTTSADGNAVVALSTSSSGEPIAFWGLAPSNGYSVLAISSDASAGGRGYFAGLLTKAGGGFQIDHPLDPANKFLYHSFVESPDMKNMYDGVATLDGNGEATVQLPDYFSAVNGDFRYQLTAIGGAMPNLHVSTEISGNQFTISGGDASTADMKVSWQVTGTRQDAWANANRMVVEESKGAKQGLYLHPDLYGQPESKSYFNKGTAPTARTVPSRPPA